MAKKKKQPKNPRIGTKLRDFFEEQGEAEQLRKRTREKLDASREKCAHCPAPPFYGVIGQAGNIVLLCAECGILEHDNGRLDLCRLFFRLPPRPAVHS